MPAYLVLARKYRPATFSDVIGQDHVIRTLSNAIVSGRIAHAFLFCGVRGVGKTTVARLLAKSLNCSGREAIDPNPCNQCTSCKEINAGISVDVQEIDGASNTSVENIREINENIKYPPVSSLYKIIIIDEVHMISINAFNALLKTLEEPPSHAKFIFATTESHKVPATINSRCQRFNFRTVSVPDVMGGMRRILETEEIEATDDALALIAREAQGSFRDALSLLDQVIALEGKSVGLENVTAILGLAGRDRFARLMKSVIARDAAAALSLVHQLFHEGYDPEQFVMDMIQYLRNLIVVKVVPKHARTEGMVDAAPSEIEQMEDVVLGTTPEELQNFLGMLLRQEGEIKRSSNPWVALEMTILRMAFAPQLVDLAEIVRGIDTNDPGTRKPAAPPSPARAASSSAKPRYPSAEPSVSTNEPPPSAGRVVKEKPESLPERFTITKVTPLPSGTTDEVWTELKARIERLELGKPVLSIMEHGTLLSFGSQEVEIGFHKAIYREQFQDALDSKAQVKEIFDDFFGDARLKVLTLSQETSLRAQEQFAVPPDGQSDLDRALRSEALDNPVTRAILGEFEGSSVDDIKIIHPKP